MSQHSDFWFNVRIPLWPLLILAATAAFGQSDRGRISGFVKDPGGLFVAQAAVTATNESNGMRTTVTANETGYYQLPYLPPGNYTISVQASGFKKFTVKGVKLDAASQTTVDAALQVGDVTESVQVVASSSAVQTETAQVGRVVESKQISDLTLNGRNPFYLAQMKAGVTAGLSGVNNFDPVGVGNGLNINGSRADTNLITMDGSIATRTRGNDGVLGVFNVDAIQEVQILTADYAAEYGRAAGGMVRFVTKSGGKAFHGALWENFRNNKLDANTWQRNQSASYLASGPQPFRFNQFGYAIGGPVYIPKKWNTDRSKLFFFTSEEFLRWRQTPTATGTVPSAAMRTGDFSQLLAPTNPFFGRSVTLTDPLTRAPFPNNVIPASQLSPNGIAFLKSYPLPTPGFQSGSQNWIGTAPYPINTRKDMVKVDWLVGGKTTITFAGTNYDWKYTQPFASPFYLTIVGDRPARTSVLSVTSAISPTLVNEANFSANADIVHIGITDAPPYLPYKRSALGITYPYLFPGTKDVEDKIPTISIQGFSPRDGSPYPSHSAGPIYSWTDNVTKITGNHTLKFGVFIEHSGQNDGDQINPSPSVAGATNNLNGQFTFLNSGGTGTAIANVALGQFNTYTEIGQRGYTIWRSTATELFAQDGWKVTPKLKLEYGVRYMFWPPWHALWGNIAMFHPAFYDPKNAAVVSPVNGSIVSGNVYNGVVLPGTEWPKSAIGRVAAASDPQFNGLFHGLPDGIVDTHHDVFDPRFGIAYAPNSKTAIRLGAGMFHNRTPMNSTAPLGGNPPVQPNAAITNGSVDNPRGSASLSYPLTETAWDPQFKIPTVWNWNFTVQRELRGGITIEAAYVGSRGNHLQRVINLNQLQPGTLQAHPGVNPDSLRPYAGEGAILMTQHAASSSYHGLQVQVQRKFKSGLGFELAYTWSKSIDDGSTKRVVLPNAFNAHTYRGRSDYDVPQVFVANYIYALPFFRGSSKIVSGVLGGWEVSGVTQFQAGLPYSVSVSQDIAGVGPGSGNQYWNANGSSTAASGGQKFSSSTADQNYWFNRAAFSQPPPGSFGNAGRNIIRGPGLVNSDVGLRKNFAIREGTRLQLRWEIFDWANHPNWSPPVVDPTSATFGKVTSKTGSRQMQIVLKLIF